jgi:hypothetical protein
MHGQQNIKKEKKELKVAFSKSANAPRNRTIPKDVEDNKQKTGGGPEM